MAYRGVVNGGVIVFEGNVPYPDGTRVDVVLTPPPVGKRKPRQPKIPGFGLMRGRKDIKNPTAYARTLRRKLMQRGGGR